MKKLVVMGLAMAMTAAMVNGVCTQPVQAADGEGLKVALLLSGAANDQGWNQTAYEGAQKACEKYGYELAYTENLEVADISAAFADYASAGYDVVIDTALGSVADGSFEGDVYNLGMADGAVEVLLSDNLSDDVKATAQDAIDKIVSGELEVERDYTMRQ